MPNVNIYSKNTECIGLLGKGFRPDNVSHKKEECISSRGTEAFPIDGNLFGKIYHLH